MSWGLFAPQACNNDFGGALPSEALRFGLIDRVEDLPATVRAAATTAGLSSFKAITYDRTQSLLERFTGLQIRNRQPFPDLTDVSSALTPRVWYLAPTAESGLLSLQP